MKNEDGQAEYLIGDISFNVTLGSENLGSEYWKREEEKKYRLCKRDKETLRHIFEDCKWPKGDKNVEEMTNIEDPDIESMLRVLKISRDRIAEEVRQDTT